MKLFKSSRLKAVNNILFQTDFKGRKMGFIQSWNLLSNFPVLEKVWKIEIKSGKKWLKVFLKATTTALWVKFFFLLVKSYSISPVCLQRIDNLDSGKRNCCFWKSLEKNLNFGSKNMCKPCKERLSYKCHYLIP